MQYKRLTYLALLTLLCHCSMAQYYLNKRTQHRFAQAYIGVNNLIVPSQGSYTWNGEIHSFPMINVPRLSIGGLHFWGKLDFNMSFALTFVGNFEVDDLTNLIFTPGGDLSARYYPWQLEFGKVRPYLGVTASQMIFGFENDQVGNRRDIYISTMPVGGFAFAYNNFQVQLEASWMPNNTRDFYWSRQDESSVSLPRSYISIGLSRYFDTTLSSERDKENGLTDKVMTALSGKGKLNSISLGFAPSGSYFLKAPEYPIGDRRSVPRHDANFNWEYSIGYLMHNQGLHAGVSYRAYRSARESYGLDHIIRRSSIALEVFKFLFDYNGFVPFIGPTVSLERWAIGEFVDDQQVGETIRTRMISPGIIFGWDILASPIETWVLRTNLRYYPLQNIQDLENRKSRVDQFEFNFIQLVIYPGKMQRVKNVKNQI